LDNPPAADQVTCRAEGIGSDADKCHVLVELKLEQFSHET